MAINRHSLWFRLLRGVVIALLALVLMAAGGAWWLLGTSSGAEWLVGTVLPYARNNMPESLQLDVQDIDADTLASIRIGKLTLADKQGIWFEAEHIALHWTPAALWHGVFDAREISAQHLHFIRLPEGQKKPQKSLEDMVGDTVHTIENLPDTVQDFSPPPVRIATLQVTRADIDSGIIDTPSAFTLDGKADLTASPPQLAIDLHSLEGVQTRATASLAEGKLAFDWQEAQGGLLGHMLPLAAPAPLEIHVASDIAEEVLHATLQATAGEAPLAEAEATLPLEEEAKIAWQAKLPKPNLLAPLAALSEPLEATGSLDSDRVHVLAQTSRIAQEGSEPLRNATAEATLHMHASDAPFVLETTLRAEKGEDPALPLAFVMRAEGDADEWDITMLNASAGADITTAATGHIALTDGEVALKGTANTPQLEASYEADVENLWETPEGTARAVLEKWKQPLSPPLDKVLATPLTLSAKTTGGDGALPDIAFTIDSESITGDGSLHPNAQGQDALAETTIDISGLPVPLHITALHRASGSGHAEATSDILKLASDYALQGDTLTLSPLALDAGKEVHLAGKVQVNTATSLAIGKLEGHIRSTAPLESLGIAAPAIKAATGKTRFTLDHPQQQQRIRLAYDSGKLDMGDAPLAGNLDVDAQLRLPQDKPLALSAKATITSLATPLTLDSATLTADGDVEKLRLAASGKNATSKSAFTAKGTLELADVLSFTLQSLAANWQENRLKLASPATLTYGSEEIRLTDTALVLNDSGQIRARGGLKQDKVDASLTLQKLPLDALPVGALNNMRGMLGGKLTVSGNATNPAASLVMEVNGLQNNYPNMTRLHNQPLMVKLRGELSNGNLAAQLSANAPDSESFAASSLTMPVDVSLAPDNLHFTPKGSIEAALRADLLLAPFLPLFLPDGVYGAGHLVADISVRGQLKAPDITGDVDLHSGLIEILQTGTTLSDITLKAKASGHRITITEGHAKDNGKGTLEFGGTLDLTPKLPMDVFADFAHFVAMRHTNATATMTGKTTLKGDLSDALLKGDWKIESAKITIAKSNTADVPDMRVVEVASLDDPVESPQNLEMSEAEREAAREKRRAERPFVRNLNLDMAIVAENQIFLDGFGLDAELKGKVNVSGTAARPKLGGKMQTVRGRWEFFGRTFTITRGEAILSEDNLAAPLIDIRAEAEAGDITAIAQISGTTDNPTIEFSSIPALPKDEILSRVMFGENLNNISPYQALQLADMLRSLSGKGGGSMNPLSKLQDTLGIDELKINSDSGDTENTTVGVGKYLQENVYLEVEGGSGENSGKVSVEVDLTNSISVETEARQNAESAVRLNYKYDY